MLLGLTSATAQPLAFEALPKPLRDRIVGVEDDARRELENNPIQPQIPRKP